MNAQAPPPGGDVPPCQLPPSAGFLGLANQLYRVEIFQSGQYNADATLVWSRDNATVESDIVCIDATGIVYVSDLGKDSLHSFTENDWVEIFDRDDALLGTPRFLAQITAPVGTSSATPCAPNVGQSYTLTLTPSPAAWRNKSSLRLRRWDMPADASIALDSNGNPRGIAIVPGWIPLENNISANFTPGFYASGSFWQIPARTATGDIEWPPYEIPNINPIPQPPMGVAHYFCRLALLRVTSGAWHLTDCRCTFPTLTEISAEDIQFHGDRCESAKLKTVQQALDELGAQIRFHNKMLHGAGVVCGLQVKCPDAFPGAESRTHTGVWVAPGYAIDYEGNDLILGKNEFVDFKELLTLSPQAKLIPDGEYELFLRREPQGKTSHPASHAAIQEGCCSQSEGSSSKQSCLGFGAIVCAAETPAQQILDGTLWSDFYNKCLKRLITAFQTDYTNGFIPSHNQVSRAQALLSSLTNLLLPLAQPQLANSVYISPQEHAVLSDFYMWIRGRLRDTTFCALLAELAPYPDYSLSNGAITSIFGKNSRTRLRVGPKGERGYAVGGDINIHVYDLRGGQLAAVVQLPAPGNAAGWIVQDVAFNRDGSEIYAIATGTNATTGAADSLFAVGVPANNFSIEWKSQSSAGPQPFVSLATSEVRQNVVYAVAQGTGLFSIEFPVGAGTLVSQIAGFNAFGHLTATNQFIFASANSAAGATATFDQVLRFDVSIPTAPPVPFSLADLGFSGSAGDDVLAEQTAFGERGALLVTATSSTATNKQLLVFQAADEAGSKPSIVDLGETATLRLASNPRLKAVMITFEESCRIELVTINNQALRLSTYSPAELGPSAIGGAAIAGAEDHVYVLNKLSNTVSAIPAEMPAFTNQDLASLADYRTQALEAYVRLIGVFLQDLKDCFCNLLLVNCPTTGANEKKLGVPLACVTFREGTVYEVCNFEARKYVKTFPTLEYWLSIVPVIPLVEFFFEKVCCILLPSIFGQFKAPQLTQSPTYKAYAGGITVESARRAVSNLPGLLMKSIFGSENNSLAPARSFVFDRLLNPLRDTPPNPGVAVSQVVGQPLQSAQDTLTSAGVKVAATVPYDPVNLSGNILDYASSPSTFAPNSSITLVVDSQGTVKNYIPSSPDVAGLRASVEDNQKQVELQIDGVSKLGEQLQSGVSALQKAQKPTQDAVLVLNQQLGKLQIEINDLRKVHLQELVARDQQIANLTTLTQQMTGRLQGMDDLAAQVKELAANIPRPRAPRKSNSDKE
jgi:hypothetical protein